MVFLNRFDGLGLPLVALIDLIDGDHSSDQGAHGSEKACGLDDGFRHLLFIWHPERESGKTALPFVMP